MKVLALVLAVLVLPTSMPAFAQSRAQPQSQDPSPDQHRSVFRFADPAITEASGLVDQGAVMVTTNDSGDAAVLYVVDPRTGETTRRVRYADAVTDVEALAPATGSSVWVGDLGDNRRQRSSVRVHLVPTGAGEERVRAPSYELRYPDGPRDAEALFTGPDGRLHVVAKGFPGGAVYVAPARLDPHRPNVLRRVHGAPALVTDAAAFPGSTVVLLRDYTRATAVDLETGAELGELALPAQPQGEAISVGPDDRVRVTSEGAHAAVIQVATPTWLRRAVAGSRRTTAAVAGVRAGAILNP